MFLSTLFGCQKEALICIQNALLRRYCDAACEPHMNFVMHYLCLRRESLGAALLQQKNVLYEVRVFISKVDYFDY